MGGIRVHAVYAGITPFFHRSQGGKYFQLNTFRVLPHTGCHRRRRRERGDPGELHQGVRHGRDDREGVMNMSTSKVTDTLTLDVQPKTKGWGFSVSTGGNSRPATVEYYREKVVDEERTWGLAVYYKDKSVYRGSVQGFATAQVEYGGDETIEYEVLTGGGMVQYCGVESENTMEVVIFQGVGYVDVVSYDMTPSIYNYSSFRDKKGNQYSSGFSIVDIDFGNWRIHASTEVYGAMVVNIRNKWHSYAIKYDPPAGATSTSRLPGNAEEEETEDPDPCSPGESEAATGEVLGDTIRVMFYNNSGIGIASTTPTVEYLDTTVKLSESGRKAIKEEGVVFRTFPVPVATPDAEPEIDSVTGRTDYQDQEIVTQRTYKVYFQNQDGESAGAGFQHENFELQECEYGYVYATFTREFADDEGGA